MSISTQSASVESIRRSETGELVATAESVGTTVGAAYGLVALASSAAAVVVPTIRAEFGLSLAGASWIITAFVVTLAASAPIYGRVADRIGTRAPVTVGLVVMAVGALVAASAQSGLLLLAGRAIQGAGAGSIPVLAPAIIALRTTAADRPRALTRMSGLAAASAAGLLLGAVLGDLVGWRLVIALPVIAVALVRPVRRLADTRTPPVARLDVVGGLAVSAIAVGVTLALQLRVSPTTGLIGLAVLVSGLAAGRWAQNHTAEPFLPASVLHREATWRVATAAATIPAAYFALLIAIPTVMTQRFDAGRITIGLLLFPAALVGAAAGPIGKRLRTRLTGRQVATLGLGLASLALLGTAASLSFPLGLALSFAAVAAAFGLGQAALLDLLTSATPPEERGAALAVFVVVFFVGGGVGGTLLITLTGSTTQAAALVLLALLPALGAVLTASGPSRRTRPAEVAP